MVDMVWDDIDYCRAEVEMWEWVTIYSTLLTAGIIIWFLIMFRKLHLFWRLYVPLILFVWWFGLFVRSGATPVDGICLFLEKLKG